MFGFEEEYLEQHEEIADIVGKKPGAWGRFHARILKFRKAGRRFPVSQHYAWWIIHNCIAHLAIGLLPHRLTFQFHDWTSKKLNAE